MSENEQSSSSSFGSSTQVSSVPGTSLFGSTTARLAQTTPLFTQGFLSSPPLQQPHQSQQQIATHTGVSCGFCGKANIKGIRYKCLQCFSYDRCEFCMAAPRAWDAHDRSHHFFPIHYPDNVADYNLVKSAPSVPPGRVIHHGISCDGCGKKNIEGTWHRCLVCEDFDFCETCIANSSKREAHHVAHPFFPISSIFGRAKYETMRNAYRAVGSTTFATSPSHIGITCDMCTHSPVNGVRYKCLDCADFDLCAQCFANPMQRQIHSLRHVFFPIVSPGDLSQFNHALAIRQTQ
ncbi:hypothetical protein L226DRAFT_493595 [Lentinus tigrinus ALCF2SS1-7]|uniref:ZZ-type domain-containing protein n=1 Tax=Lentinus tigrinus ALCF2SS1-6 TaxID=1328759 RepID=A0A5C2RT75_9APHY|nr:hypothetical protein L227DRAFT_555781 [Lentinus tigrinus ALCF2SS1-6]RPD69911.1 hypothetical protein L226DRAFT_493595 [Lentinus tigrinus ALCF2SS1-7]